ncbi:MAG TPA: 30S ribosomal protein S6 [Oculatellaceae cyanobacterium]
MQTYEAFIILKPILDVDNSDSVLKSVEELIEAQGGKVIKKDKLGRKRLAYEVQKFKDGFITTYLFTLPSEKVATFKRACSLNEDILRFVLVNRSKVDMTDASVFGRDRSSDRGERESRRPARSAS